MLLSRSCVYGIRAALYVAASGGSAYLPIRQISERLEISFHFLTKILQTLTHGGIMVSLRGPNGGVALARPACEILLMDIVKTLDGTKLFDACFLGLAGCGHKTPCPLHEQWGGTRDRIELMLSETSLEKLAARVRGFELRISDLESPDEGTASDFF